MNLHSDFSDLLVEFVRFEVRFALLGGYAVGVYAKPRATKDLDLLVSGEGDNLERVSLALAAFGAPARVVADAHSMGSSEIVYLGVPPLRIDILRSADGVETEEVLAAVNVIELPQGLKVPVISLAHLMANKRAAGRPQDLADVAALEKI